MSNVECRMERFIVAVILLASVKVAEAGRTGACCLPNGSCALLSATSCAGQNGVFRGSEICLGVVCTGACCLPNGSCTSASSQNCTTAAGEFRGFGSQCANQVCGGACCHANGSCALSNEAACASPDTFQGLGSACGTVDCTGACCASDGSCFLTSEIECTGNFGGEFLGLEAECEDVVCGGACCHANGSCALSNEASCTSPNTFQGLGSACGTVVCTGACCLPEKTCVQTGLGSCAQAGGTYQGHGSVCGDDCPVAMPQGFTYQGQLKRGGVPLSGAIDARFSLWLSLTGQDPSDQIGGTLLRNAIEVANGLFSVDLDFGQNAFNGNARWLQIEVRDHDDPPGTFTLLSPRQPLTPSPYSLETRGIVVLENGDVGIGTKTPFAKLHVKGFGEGLHIEGPFVGPENSAWVGFYDANQTPIGWVGDLSVGDSSVYLASDTGDVHLYTNARPTVTAKNDGRVGIGTVSPAAKLDVRGDIKLGSSGEFFASSGEENLRIVRGVIGQDGSILVGTGFSVTHPSIGRYTITFNPPFAGPPTLTATTALLHGFASIAQVFLVGATSADLILVQRTDGSSVDRDVHFFAIGLR